MAPGDLTIERVDPDDPDAVACIRAYYALLGERFPIGFDPSVMIPVDGDSVRPPNGAFLLARQEGRAVGCVGLKLHGAESAEMKRLWVDASVRGVGLGRRLVEAIEAEATAASAPGVRLDTNETLVEAIAMYRSLGYVEIEPFTDEPYATHWFEKRFGADVHVHELPTPALVVDLDALDANIARMAERWPGTTLRPHVKAFKSTALARRLADAGHTAFCAATLREVDGLAAAGLGEDILLANEVVDVRRLHDVVVRHLDARITVAVDSDETVDVAAEARVGEVLIDVDVGMPRCGCRLEDAGRLAERARSQGLEVRGVMGYEGHLMAEADDRAGKVEAAMAILAAAHADVGGDVVSGGGTGTWDCNHGVTELQAGSFTLMDTHYEAAGVGFAPALSLLLTVVSVNRTGGWAAADGGLKALGMDHGNSSIDGAMVWYHADEHTVFSMDDGAPLPAVGERISVRPAHVDPTVSQHEQLWVVQAGEVVDRWPVDLRGW